MKSKIFRRSVYFISILLLIILLLLLLLQLPFVQNFAKNKILASLSEQLASDWQIDNIEVDFFDELIFDGIKLLDQKGDTLLVADKLSIDIGVFSLLRKVVKIDEVNLSNARFKVYELEDGKMNYDFLLPGTTKDSTSSNSFSAWDYSLSDILINNSTITYETAGQYFHIEEEEIQIAIDHFDLEASQIRLRSLKMKGLDIVATIAPSNSPSSDFNLPWIDWSISADQLSIAKSKLKYNGRGEAIEVKDLESRFYSMQYSGDSLSVNIENIAANLNNKVNLKKLEGALVLKKDVLTMPQLNILTERDRLKLSGLSLYINKKRFTAKDIDTKISHNTLLEVQPLIPDYIKIKDKADFEMLSKAVRYYPGLIYGQGIALQYGNVLSLDGNIQMTLPDQSSGDRYLDANLSGLKINLQEFENIFPSITVPDSLRQFKELNLQGAVVGDVNDLVVNKLEIQIDNVFKGVLSGEVKNITDLELVSFDVAVEDMSAVIDKLPISKNDQIAIDSLGMVKYHGMVQGTLKNIDLNGALDSDLGSAVLDVKFNIPDSIQNISYDGAVDLNRFKLGVLLKNSEYDEITIATKVKGKGIDLENIDSSIDGTISNFSYSGYKYAVINLNAIVKDSSINGKLSIDDPNLKLQYDGIIKISAEESIFDFTTNLDTANLAKLGFINNDISLSGFITSQFHLPLLPGKEGVIKVKDFYMNNPAEKFYADTILLSAFKTLDSTFVDIRSDSLSLDLDGDYNIKDLPNALKRVVDHHVAIVDYGDIDKTESRKLSISGVIKTLEPVDVWLQKELIESKEVRVKTSIDFTTNDVNGRIEMDSLYYASNSVEKLSIDLSTSDGQLEIDAVGDNNDISGAFIPKVIFKNDFGKDAIISIVEATDIDKLPRLKFAFETSKPNSTILITVNDSVILNQKEWLVNSDNNIKVSTNSLLINNFQLTDGNEFLTVESRGNRGGEVDINFNNFNIGQFTSLIDTTQSRLDGNINGEVGVKDLFGEMYYLLNLRIEDVVYDSTAVGVLTINASDDPQTNILTTNLDLKGPRNDVTGQGTYNTKSHELYFNYGIKSLEMILLDPFFSEIFYDSKGVLSGEGKVTGTIDKPNLSGYVKLKEIESTMMVNKVRYFIKEHEISFDNSSFKIGDLEIRDKDDNLSTVTGEITHNFLEQFYLDLNVKTNDFLLLNTSSKDNPVFYGKMVMNANAQIKGPPELLDISIVATTLDSTSVTLSPLSSEQLELEEDYITYGKPDDFEDVTDEYLLKVARLFPFKVNLSLDLTKDAKLSFVVDPVTGDKIDVSGTGDLRIILNPDGQQEIYGTCTVEDGTYNFSYGDFISKQFQLKPGGSIRFNGDPLEALLDIDAIYKVYTSTYGLIQNEISLDESGLSSAKERTNVEVYLSLDGSIEEPLISLDIEIPDQESNSFISSIDRKLNELRSDPNEMNTQVFNLLIFDNFLVADNASSGFNSIGSSIALSSVSNLISNELNRLAGNVIKGVDVRINVDSYDSNYANNGEGGTVTEVGLNVSKQLFNDRLSLSAGGNIDFADSAQSDQSYASLIGDFVLEYKLVESGRLRLRVFSKSDYDRLLDQNNNKNGISLFFNKSFDSKLKN